MSDFVRVETSQAIRTVTVQRLEKLNALNTEVMSQLEGAITAASTDASLRCLIVTGAGEKAFIAGADIGELAKLTPIEGREHARRGQAVLDAIEGLPIPTIAAINGFAYGGAEAERIGLVNRVVPAGSAHAAAVEIAKKIAAVGPTACRFAMEAIRRGVEMPLAEGLNFEATLFGLCAATEDMKEGMTAFLEKRVPRFTGH